MGTNTKTVKGDIYMSVDDEANALLKRWNAQQSAMQGLNPNLNQGKLADDGVNVGTDQSPHLFKEGAVPTSPDQTPEDPTNSVRPMDFSIPKTGPTMPDAAMATNVGAGAATGDVCKQCGTMHPPVAEGATCPLKSVASEPDKTGGLDDTTVNKHLVDMRNIIMAQVSAKGIKDGKKFFQHLVIELTKVMEGYNE